MQAARCNSACAIENLGSSLGPSLLTYVEFLMAGRHGTQLSLCALRMR